MTRAVAWLQVGAMFMHGFAQPWLAVAGIAALILAPAGAIWAILDGRRVGGERVALKPTRFALSIGVYLLTVSWALSYARPEPLSSPLVSGAVCGLLIGAAVEFGCIVFQAARGRRSHFNLATPSDAAISGVMGVMALIFTGMVLPIGWEIARRPRPGTAPIMVWAVVAGLVATFVLTGLTGTAMGRLQTANADAHADAAVARLPLFGIVRGGSLRIAHFLGVHALQACPLMGVAAMMLRGWAAVATLAVGVVLYVGVTLMLCSRFTGHAHRPAGIATIVASGR